MALIRSIVRAWSAAERRAAFFATVTLFVSGIALSALTVAAHSTFVPVAGGTYREGVVGQPSIINPIVSPNPADQDLATLLFSPLGTLASVIEPENGGASYTVKLAENLSWSDGAPLTSDDVVFSVGIAQDPAAESSFALALRGVRAERVSILQVKLTLPVPNALFGDMIRRLLVIPAHVWGRIPVKNYHLSEYALLPVGSGPYVVAGFSKAKDGFLEEYRLAPNPRYHGTAPFIADFGVRFFESSAALLDAFRLRRIHGFGFLPPFPEAAGVAEGMAVRRVELPRYYAIFMNAAANDTFADQNFRTALTLGVNRARIAREAFGGDAMPYLPGTAAEDAAATHRPDEARAALLKARYNPETAITLTVPDVSFLVKAAELVAEDWREIGAPPVAINKVSLPRFREEILTPRAYELVLTSHARFHPFDLFPFWHSAARGATGENFSLYANIRMDSLLDRVRKEINPEARAGLIADAEALLVSDVPAAFLVSVPYTHIHIERLEGFPSTPLVTPADRFLNVNEWSVARVRVLE